MERLTEKDSYGDVYVKQHDYVTASEKLAEYEDLYEQGLLLRLPCKVGDTLYSALGEKVLKSEVISVKYHCEAENHGVFIRERIIIDTDDFETEINFSDIGKTVFLTQTEAEQKLKEMESD